jgi:hypothetical protein
MSAATSRFVAGSDDVPAASAGLIFDTVRAYAISPTRVTFPQIDRHNSPFASRCPYPRRVSKSRVVAMNPYSVRWLSSRTAARGQDAMQLGQIATFRDEAIGTGRLGFDSAVKVA